MPETILIDLDRQMLDLEREKWKTPGAKESAIKDRLKLSATRYYQILNQLISTEAALAYDPITVKRLLRIRDHRQVARSGADADLLEAP